jgi:hypothetical protein
MPTPSIAPQPTARPPSTKGPRTQARPADRAALFAETGPDGAPTILVVQIDGIDAAALWRDDQDGEPAVVKGSPGATLSVFKATPALQAKAPDASLGVIQTLQGDRVSVKRRGNTSRRDPKPNLCVALDDDDDAGIPKQLNLTNCIRDPAYQRIRLAWALLGEARCPVQPCMYGEVTLDGTYEGTYVAMAPIDKYHFRTLFPETRKAAVFRGQFGDISGGATLQDRGPNGADYFRDARSSKRTYEPRLDTKDAAYGALARFVTTLHHSGDPAGDAFAKAMRGIFDVEGFLRTMVLINLLGSWDAYYLNAQNYILHIALDGGGASPDEPFVTFCPYDQDSVLGVSWPGQKRNWQDKDFLFRGTEIGQIPLLQRILQNPGFRAYYLDFMSWFVQAQFTVEGVDARMGAFWKTLEQSVYLESRTPSGPPDTRRPWTNDQVYRHAVNDEQFDAQSGAVAGLQVTGIRQFVRARREKVLSQLKGEQLGRSGVDFTSGRWTR